MSVIRTRILRGGRGRMGDSQQWTRRGCLGLGLGALGVAALTACHTGSSSGGGPVVRTTKGQVRGVTDNGVSVFRGIPYAQPPVGELRFAAPVPHAEWSGVTDADQFGPPPPQTPLPTSSTGWKGRPDAWLTLNVWSLSIGNNRLPVMVWFYGGAFQSGSSADPTFDGRMLARTGVVVVTVNYRVAVEGFTMIEGSPANRGLLDQVAGLQWVRANIAAFGGDPGNVTIFGQSAGASSVTTLMTLPAAAGLFHRGIAESVAARLQTPRLAADIAGAIAGRIQSRATLEDLRDVDPQRLADAYGAVVHDLPQYQDRWGYRMVVGGSLSGPVVDGSTVPTSPWKALAAGMGRDIDLIVGHTRDEYNLAIAAAGGPSAVTATQISDALRWLPPVPDGALAYREAYPGADDETLYQLACSDSIYRMPSLHIAQAHTVGGGRTYLYEFAFGASVDGAAHTTEIPLVFGTLDSPNGTKLYGSTPTAATVTLGDAMRAAWTSFAARGEAGWPAYSPDVQPTQIFDAASRVAPYPEQNSERIWANCSFDAADLQLGTQR
ncbi:carboxylesterase/lipase family protein [Nocardia inohanensis]|uniref:carboxylesterase/lipase family protein n=1 Tax=Nocardia inohanensis TaxID=209246 RepID=UPI001C3FD34A|nr:carboxylesterase family protein [Nocardia inohanensis]